MDNKNKTKVQLIDELIELHKRNAELEKNEINREMMRQELKQTQKGNEAVLDRMSEIVVFQDKNMSVKWANKTKGNSAGLDSGELINRYCYEIKHQRKKQCVVCPIKKIFELQEPNEREMTSPDGKMWFVHGYPVHNDKGELLCVEEVTQDITERKKAEEEISNLSKFPSENPDPVLRINVDGEILYNNAAVDRLLKKAKLSRKQIYEILPNNIYNLTKKALKTGETMSNLDVQVDSGIFSYSLVPVVENNYINLYGRDITKSKETEEALRESEQRYRRITEAVTDYVYTVHIEEGKPVKTVHSPTCFAVTGYTTDEFASDPYLWINMVYDDDRDDVKEQIFWLYTGQDVIPLEYRIIRKDGVLRWMKHTVVPRFNNGSLLSYDGLIHDITEQKLAEEKFIMLSTAVEQAIEGIIITDSDMVIQYVNPAFELNSGYLKEEIIGNDNSLFEIINHDNLLSNDLKESLSKEEIWKGHIHRQKKSGNKYDVEAVISPIINRGKIIHYVYIERDVTHEIEIEGQLLHAQKMEAIGTLAAGIAHDFNNILGSIMLNTELALQDLPPESSSHQLLNRVLKSSQRAEKLVDQILTFSRQSAKERKPIQIASIIKDTFKFLKATLPSTIEIRFDIKNKDTVIMCDPVQIHQVLLNLSTNSAHAMRENGGVLEIKLTNIDIDTETALNNPELSSGSFQRLTVSDTGSGMSQETIEKIFNPFFTTKSPEEGTGMGLAIVHGIVKSSNGAITVHSELGKGSTFQVFFPIADIKILQTVTKNETPPKGKERILLVDDEEEIVIAGVEILKKLGYAVTGKTNSFDALDSFSAQPDQFDIIITDLTMPKMTGVELSKKLLKIRPDIPIIICTGYKEDIMSEEIRELGICDILRKPFFISQIAECIRRVLDRKIVE